MYDLIAFRIISASVLRVGCKETVEPLTRGDCRNLDERLVVIAVKMVRNTWIMDLLKIEAIEIADELDMGCE